MKELKEWMEIFFHMTDTQRTQMQDENEILNDTKLYTKMEAAIKLKKIFDSIDNYKDDDFFFPGGSLKE